MIIDSVLKLNLVKDQYDSHKIRKLLTLPNPAYTRAAKSGRFYAGMPDKELEFFYDTGKGLIVPRNIPQELLGSNTLEPNISQGHTVTTPFAGKLREYQVNYIVEHIIPAWQDSVNTEKQFFDCIHVAAPGLGKTAMSLYVAAKYAVTTLVLCPTNELILQWGTRIAEFLPGAKVLLCNPKTDLESFSGYDIVVLSNDLLESRKDKISNEFYDYFGHVIVDELHLFGAPTLHSLISLFPAKYRTGLTATFRREDSVHKILACHFGQQYVMERQFPAAKIYPFATGVSVENIFGKKLFLGKSKKPETIQMHEECFKEFVDALDDAGWLIKETNTTIEVKDELDLVVSKIREVKIDLYRYTGKRKLIMQSFLKKISNYEFSYVTADSHIAENMKRNMQFLLLVEACIKKGRMPLLLSKRKDVLTMLYNRLIKRGYDVALVLGGKKEKGYLDKLNGKQAVLGIDKLVQFGLDVDNLDTLILLLPIKDIEQAIGRVERFKEGKKDPLVIYPYDNIQEYQNLFRAGETRKMQGSAKIIWPALKLQELIEKL